MVGIDERVKNFLESWAKIRENTLLSIGPLRCAVCDRELEDGGFAIVDGDPVCQGGRESIRGG
jgi:hypothetical protein